MRTYGITTGELKKEAIEMLKRGKMDVVTKAMIMANYDIDENDLSNNSDLSSSSSSSSSSSNTPRPVSPIPSISASFTPRHRSTPRRSTSRGQSPPDPNRMNQQELRRQLDLETEDERQRSNGRKIAGITHTPAPSPPHIKKVGVVPR